ncbi:MAG: hypothetical protein KDB61_00955, partial [Planctomycetes bacterium]|nr:hypothetical protein [Planctomycetota bacterium]
IGGVEVVRYSGTDGNKLILTRRGAQDELDVDYLDGARAFILDYGSLLDTDGNEVNERMERSLFCVPISLPVSPVGLFPSGVGTCQYAQVTHTDAGELTEWIRYNIVQPSFRQLVRLDEEIVLGIVDWFHAGSVPPIQSGLLGGSPPPLSSPAPAVVSTIPSAPQSGGVTWRPQLGEEEELALPLSRAIADRLRFRGVADTYPQTHEAGTPVLPVFRVDSFVQMNPGAQDPVFLTGGLVASAGMQTNVVHRGYSTPASTPIRTYQDFLVNGAAAEAASTVEGYPVIERGEWVGLSTGLPTDLVVGSVGGASSNEDPRLLPRMAKFPSGERPSSADQVAIGGNANGANDTLPIPEVVVDEVVFQTLTHGQGLINGYAPESLAGSGLVLGEDLSESDTALRVNFTLLSSRGQLSGDREVLNTLPFNVGLARIGDEILCYVGKDYDTGWVELAPGGRGLLGTRPTPHAAGTVLYPITTIPVCLLAAEIDGDSAELPVDDSTRFPEEGTLLIGAELCHYTGKAGSAFTMPRASLEVGLQDGEGPGVFRGRFGTEPAAALAGTPVIFFPWRYWDRWQPGCDVPELSYLGLRVDQPGALFEDVFYQVDPIPFGGVTMESMLRMHRALPWDGDPDETPGLFLLDRGTEKDEQPWVLDVVSDALEARFFVEYQPGCFDPINGGRHGWKYTPRLRRFGVGYEAPGEVLWSVDR